MKKFFIIISLFLISVRLFSFVSTAQDGSLYSEIISFQGLQVSTKSFLDTAIEFYYPEKTLFGSTGETVNSEFCAYIPYYYWNESPSLSSIKVTPAKGKPLQSFEFSVVYTAANPPAYGYPKVRIFREGSEIVGSPFSLNGIFGDYQTGLLCSTNVVLSVPSDKYTFKIFTYDIYNFYSETEISSGPIVNTPPQLQWVDEKGYTYDGVEPNFGDINTNFCFKVKYIDADNHQPKTGYPKLYILEKGTTNQLLILSMNYVSGVYNAAAVYSTFTKLNTGEYDYQFVTYDIWNESSNILSSGTIIVGGPCEVKVVEYTSELSPLEKFYVKVQYKNINGYPPTFDYPKITFYLKDKLIHEATMEYVSGSYADAYYLYSIKFSTVSGDYSFVCSAVDTTGLWPVTYTEKKRFVVSTPPTQPKDLTNYQDKNNTVSVSSKVTLKWGAEDPDKNKITYQLYFGDSLDNMKKIYEGEDTEYTVYNLEDNKTYYWYVVAVDDTGRETQSKMFSFSTVGVQQNKVFNYPNPVKKGETTNIVFYSEENTTAEIYICTLFGEVVFKDIIQVYKGSNVYSYKPDTDIKSGSYKVVIKIGSGIKKGYILVLNR